MATHAAANVLSKGPLSSALGQWMFLGFGTYVIFTGENGVSRAAQELAGLALRLATGVGREAAYLRDEAALVGRHHHHQQQQQLPHQPVVIYQSDGNGRRGGAGYWIATVVQVGLGAGACWTAYVLISNFLPDNIKEMMPVTRRFFESAVTSLGQGILRVRDALSEQILALGLKQDELSAKMDETRDGVLGLRDDLGDVRLHVDDIASAISRCERSLSDAADKQTYVSRGVSLLVRCVGDLLRPGNPEVAEELDRFGRLSSEMMEGDDFYRLEVVDKKNRDRCPSSPQGGCDLSEIGSNASFSADDCRNRRSSSLPRPRRSSSRSSPDDSRMQSSINNVVTPRHVVPMRGASNDGGGDDDGGAVANHRHTILPSPVIHSVAPGSTSRVLKMLQSFNGGVSSYSGYPTKGTQYTRSYSSPEDEVPPQSNSSSSGNVTPESDVSDPIKLEDVDELLRMVRMM
ncbi:hypothetical protein ACHAXA_005293 [Cyclostephanos tholiformis]|uniref:Uncharacterized protein n=1 Tax=Cyclostephanos tholiformis TaxID=382380 RepID=A0ABD3RAV5_9STRA